MKKPADNTSVPVLMDDVDLQEIIKIFRLRQQIQACHRAMSIANALPDKDESKRLRSRIFSNLNRLRAQIKKLIG